ncbi:hypothetical protein BX600DRAFT_231063 [Xylariales sp. PMI_506]|nr:hypothetical protein BX600DRAFT_231063 [Xylariales sp. PMI_506]
MGSYETYCISPGVLSGGGQWPSPSQIMSRGHSHASYSSVSTYDAMSPTTPKDLEQWDYYNQSGSPDASCYDSSYPVTHSSVPYHQSQDPQAYNDSWNYDTGGYQNTICTGYYSDGSGYVGSNVDTVVPMMTQETQMPRTTTTDAAPVSGASGTTDAKGFVCLYEGCESKSFRRKADLQRHYNHIHTSEEQKEQYHCDYKACSRRSEPFHRVDHYRDHYRDYHKEDLRKKGQDKGDWIKDRRVSQSWWRCIKCLTRIQVSDGWQCQTCNYVCDATRRQLRGHK